MSYFSEFFTKLGELVIVILVIINNVYRSKWTPTIHVTVRFPVFTEIVSNTEHYFTLGYYKRVKKLLQKEKVMSEPL